ncbi:MAG: hypothetical protein E6Q97_30515 [Desulfurellales bacterium]|nr:MAG: hypothetical protein E6Q97_30515 [Desulfurellales bacterium]
MAAIAIAAADRISLLFPDNAEVYNGIAGVAITRGQAVYFHATTGRLALSNAGAAGTAKFHGIALNAAGIGQAISILKRGHIAGFTLAGNYGSLAYLNDTDGVIGDAAGTVSAIVGAVVPLSDFPTLTKVLYINALNWAA